MRSPLQIGSDPREDTTNHWVRTQDLVPKASRHVPHFVVRGVLTENYQEVTPGISQASHLEWEMGAGLRCPLRVPRRSRCAVRRHGLSVGANPTRRLSLQPVAIGAV